MKQSTKEGFVLWFTGLPCAGKTTIADHVARQLQKRGVAVERLDGDIVRKTICADLGFSKADRDVNIARVAFVAALLSRNRVGVIASFISPYRRQRNEVRRQVTNFIEVFVDTPLAVCEARDTQGLYQKARAGELPHLTGVSAPYEKPTQPEIVLQTHRSSVEENTSIVLEYLAKHKYIAP